jgi:hypothetical protein
VVENIQAGLAFSAYVEEMPSSPPFTIPPPLTRIPPTGTIMFPPPPPPVMQKKELTMRIVVAPVVAGVSLCSYIIFVFYRRRRTVQEIHLEDMADE